MFLVLLLALFRVHDYFLLRNQYSLAVLINIIAILNINYFLQKPPCISLFVRCAARLQSIQVGRGSGEISSEGGDLSEVT